MVQVMVHYTTNESNVIADYIFITNYFDSFQIVILSYFYFFLIEV